MLPSRRSENPDAPAHLARKAIGGDRFRTPVYHISECDLFITINHETKPEPYDWVIDSNYALALYDGQPIIGVVEVLNFYPLIQSEQWRPKIRSRFTNW